MNMKLGKISKFPTDEDIVEPLGSKSDFELDSESDIEDDLQDDMVQPVSIELVANSFKILRSYLKTNEHTTDSLYNGLNNIEAFFEDQNKKSSRQSQITDFFTLKEWKLYIYSYNVINYQLYII
ncbi:uncharacterized protein LOC129250231 [Anastrepha obliqua]|uniref:uncharacterized protein LOC129250231 n=1 Tax=Anastrepha obliqua TaxID=95512 RepID=UPI0024091BA5|nr:uncharacterized protein LOC129250231 [Anastrepha obliqua]